MRVKLRSEVSETSYVTRALFSPATNKVGFSKDPVTWLGQPEMEGRAASSASTFTCHEYLPPRCVTFVRMKQRSVGSCSEKSQRLNSYRSTSTVRPSHSPAWPPATERLCSCGLDRQTALFGRNARSSWRWSRLEMSTVLARMFPEQCLRWWVCEENLAKS